MGSSPSTRQPVRIRKPATPVRMTVEVEELYFSEYPSSANRSRTPFNTSLGAESACFSFRARQSTFLIASARTTPLILPCGGNATSNGEPLTCW